MKKITALFGFAAILLINQDVNSQKAEAALKSYATQNPIEKLYLHYDKEYYVTGETIWFKAYILTDGKPSGLSSNLYLQLLDSKGNIVSDNRFPVLGAVSKGNIFLPDSLPQGNYYVRAYTPMMRNEGESFIYKKNIFVFRPNATKTSTSAAQNISLQFFPESGDLLEGLIMTTAFKAVDQWGNPVEVNGLIKTTEGITIAPFSTYHYGMGKISFKPMPGRKYIAEVETANGLRTYSLPETKSSGINLKITDEKGGKKFQLSRGEKDKANFDVVTMVAQINNQVVFENEIAFEDYPSVVGHLLTDSLPSGILHFTVFNKTGIPIAERLSFVDNGEYRTNATINNSNISTEKRAANEIEISFPDAIQRSASVSITDLSGFSFNDDDNIYSRFLLTGDLKGHIHNPSWYFNNSTDSARTALDNLLLTQGWSRFNWSAILEGKLPVRNFSDQPFISLRGVVKDEKGITPLSGGRLNFYVEAEDSTETTYEIPVNANGEFSMDSLIFSGNTKFFYAYLDAKEKVRPAKITLEQTDYLTTIRSVPDKVLDNTIMRYPTGTNKSEVDIRYGYVQTQFNEVKELERITLQAKSRKKPFDIVNEKYTTGVWRTAGKENLDNINSPANDKSLSVVDYIKNSIQQIRIQNNQFVNIKNFSLMSGQNWVVGAFLNESPVTLPLLRPIRMQDVALIKFYEAGFVGVGSTSPGGAIAVYTKEKFREEEKPEKLAFFEYKGYTITKEFYNPDYSSKDIKAPATDNRSTLYWNPDTFTDTESKILKVKFFNNDYSRKFKVVVEGFDVNGKLLHVEKIITSN